MKRLSFILMALIMASGIAFAQQGESAVSVNLGYGSGSFHKAFKVGAEYKYNITDAIRIAPGFDYFFKSDGIGLWSANVNGHYLFDIKGAEGLKIYPLFGFTLLGTMGSADAGDYDPGDYLPDGYEDMYEDIYGDALEEADGGNEKLMRADPALTPCPDTGGAGEVRRDTERLHHNDTDTILQRRKGNG